MTSINTNIAAQTALRTLQSTNAQLDQTQSRISTGLKIGEAKDNAAYWSISTTLKSDNKALGTVKDSLSLGAGAVDTAYQGMQNVLNVLDEIKSKVTAASGAAANKEAIQLELGELMNQLVSYTNAATFAGENWLEELGDGEEGARTIVSGFIRGEANAITLTNIDVDTSSMRLTGADSILGTVGKAAGTDPATDPEVVATGVFAIDVTDDAAVFNTLLGTIETAIDSVKTQAATLGAIASRIELQQTFVSNLMDTIDKGVSGLIDADMNEESTRLQALQVKQQLGVQALSIANQSAQNVLRLFQ